MEKVEIVFKYTQYEYIKAYRQHLFMSKVASKINIILGSILVPFSLFNLFWSHFSLLSVILVTLVMVVAAIFFMLYFYIPKRHFKLTSKFQEEYKLLFSEEGIVFKTENINSNLKWDVYTEIWENKEFYFLVQNAHLYTILPKRAFASVADIEIFERVIPSTVPITKRIV